MSADFLTFSAKKHRTCKSISELNKRIFGRFLCLAYDCIYGMYVLLVIIAVFASLSKIVYLNFNGLIWSVFKMKDVNKQNFDTFNGKFPYVVAAFMFCMIVPKSVDSLRYVSLFSFGVFVFITAVCIFQTPYYYNSLVENKQNFYNMAEISLVGFFQTFGCLIFSFNIINSFYSVVNLVQNPTKRRMRKMFSRTFVILGLLSAVIGFVSYLSLGKTKATSTDLFIFRFSLGDSDVVMYIGRCLLLISFMTSCALNGFSLKNMFFDVANLNRNWKWHVFLAFVISAFCAVVVSNFSYVTGFVAFAGAFVAFIRYDVR